MNASRLGLLVVLALGCQREQRRFEEASPSSSPSEGIQMSSLTPGNPMEPMGPSEYEENAYAISEGKRLFAWFNCVGCHAHGGGGMGPPLMDAQWRYGSDAANIFASIVEGRPNGMPSFRGKIPRQQVWQLAAYVRSMAGLVRSDAAPGRDDHLSVTKPESRHGPQGPVAEEELHP